MTSLRTQRTSFLNWLTIKIAKWGLLNIVNIKNLYMKLISQIMTRPRALWKVKRKYTVKEYNYKKKIVELQLVCYFKCIIINICQIFILICTVPIRPNKHQSSPQENSVFTFEVYLGFTLGLLLGEKKLRPFGVYFWEHSGFTLD